MTIPHECQIDFDSEPSWQANDYKVWECKVEGCSKFGDNWLELRNVSITRGKGITLSTCECSSKIQRLTSLLAKAVEIMESYNIKPAGSIAHDPLGYVMIWKADLDHANDKARAFLVEMNRNGDVNKTFGMKASEK